MNKLKSLAISLIVGAIGIVIGGILLQHLSGEKGVAIAFISLFTQAFRFVGIDETMWTVIIFVILAIIFFGSLYLSRRQENKLWYIASILAGIIGYLTLFKK